MEKKLTKARKLTFITKSGWNIAYDGCHKIYFLQDEERENYAKKYGYKIYPSSKLKEIYKHSCGLKFVSRLGYNNDDFEHEWNIDQFEK